MKHSSHTTGVVQGMLLTFQHEGGEVTAEVGSAAWFEWLEQATAFTFRDDVGHFTAHKTQAGNRRGGSYWRATRRSHGRLSSYYLGASARLTGEHLRQAAHALSARAGADHRESEEASTMPDNRLALPASPVEGSGLALPSSSHLPRPVTALLGREYERAQVLALLHRPEVRLLTLTGPGGVGKTRLALEAARDLVPDFADGVCFVPLAAISQPDFVLPAIVQALGLRETGARAPLEELQAALGSHSLLLLLDNFEQVLAAAPPLADLLAACPQLKLLVTSRAPLRLSGEHELAVFPLALPDLAHLPVREALVQSAACALFVERAQAMKLDFQVTEANARSIAEVCIRLDGLPLAIELAAARSRLLSPQALLSRLSHRLEVLTGGGRDAPARQQTLRSTIAWSYQLLAPEEQRLFRWLCVFAGGCMLRAIEAIARHADLRASQVLDGVSALLENSLLQQAEQADGEPRLLLLETIRAYGLESLESCGELEAAQAAHAAYYLRLSEQAEPHLRGAEHARWVAQLGREQENLRAALRFLLEQAQAQAGLEEGEIQGERALRLCIALSWFWDVRGYGQEGLRAFSQALAERAGGGVALRARALHEAAELAYTYARHTPFERQAEQSLALYQELGDPVGIANSLSRLGSIARIRSQFALAHARLEEAAVRFQELGDRWKLGMCLTERARVATEQGQYEQARALLSESLLLYQALGEQQRLGWVHYLQARLLFVSQQDQALARALAERSLAQFQEQENPFDCSIPLGLLGLICLEDGELEAARALLEESLAVGKQVGVETDTAYLAVGLARLLARQGEVAAARRLYLESVALLLECEVYQEQVAACLEGLAALEAGQEAPRQAVWLWGAAHALRKVIGAPLYPVSHASHAHALAHARSQLGEQSFRTAWAEGRSMTPQQALAAQGQVQLPTPLSAGSMASPLKSTTFPAGLTAREVEVLRGLSQGWTDAQIAEHLVISLRTVNRHTTSLYSKLGVSSRVAATRAALEHHLL
jgi:predicted ATPase/DNA-binding CsgD family transcriptional regulator